jgi:hypothetical protein
LLPKPLELIESEQSKQSHALESKLSRESNCIVAALSTKFRKKLSITDPG